MRLYSVHIYVAWYVATAGRTKSILGIMLPSKFEIFTIFSVRINIYTFAITVCM